MTEENKHARLAPSAAERWMNCPGSLAMEEMRKPKGTSDYAEEGTAAHELAALAITESNPCEAYIGHKMKNGWKVTRDMADDTQIYVDKIWEYAEGNRLLVEQKLSIEHITTEKDAYGTSDAVIITNDLRELQIHDLKFGRGIKVDANYNRQLMIYALAALEAYRMIGEFERIRLVIHQPRLNHLSEWDISVADIALFFRDARSAAEQAFEIAACNETAIMAEMLKPGDDQCRWCAAKANCPALSTKISETIGAQFEDLTALAVIDDLIPEDTTGLSAKMKAIDMIQTWCTAVRAEVEHRLLVGTKVPGYKIVEGKQGNRKWIDTDEVEELMKKMRIKQQDMYDFSIISPTQAQKLLKKNEKQWKKLQTHITRTDGKPSVAEESDSRPAMIMKPVENHFEDLTNPGSQFA